MSPRRDLWGALALLLAIGAVALMIYAVAA